MMPRMFFLITGVLVNARVFDIAALSHVAVLQRLHDAIRLLLVLTSINVHHSPTSIMIPNKGLKVAHKECENSYIVFAQFSDKLPWR